MLNHYKALEQLLQETIIWVLLGRVFPDYNHNEFSLAGLLLLYHILFCIFQPTLQVPFFLPTILSFTSNECFSHFNVQQVL